MKVGPILCGILFIISGVGMFKTGWVNHYQGPVYPGAGVLLGIIGLIFIFWGIIPSSKNKIEKLYICKDCEKTYKKESVAILKCPICNGKLVDHKEPKQKV